MWQWSRIQIVKKLIGSNKTVLDRIYKSHIPKDDRRYMALCSVIFTVLSAFNLTASYDTFRVFSEDLVGSQIILSDLFDDFSGMRHIHLLDFGYTAESGNLAGDFQSGCRKHALPGILIITGHVIVGMVSGNYHQRT